MLMEYVPTMFGRSCSLNTSNGRVYTPGHLDGVVFGGHLHGLLHKGQPNGGVLEKIHLFSYLLVREGLAVGGMETHGLRFIVAE